MAEHVLTTGGSRLVTFSGPAGVGKSWTARELKRRLVTGHGWPAVTVHVDHVRGFSELMAAVANAMGMPARGGALRDRLAAALAGRPRLLVLDRCEHLVGTPHPAVQLIELAPELRVVVTSLRPTGAADEHVVGLDPFPVPAPTAGPDELEDSPAVRLFCATAEQTVHGFVPEDADLVAIAELCRRVHGHPLAIEIMASRVDEQRPAAMVSHLNSGHEFSYRFTRDSDDPRHLSLASALQWSYSELAPPTARLLCRMSVFAGPATLDMLEAVVPPEDRDDGRLLDNVSKLVDHRLAERYPGPGEPAFRLVDLVRDFAVERLVEEGEQAATEDAHTRAVVALATSRSEAVEIGEDEVAHSELARSEVDLRTVMRRLLGRGDVDPGLRLAVALAPFVLRRGYDGFVGPALGSLLRRAGDRDDELVARAELWLARLVAHFDGPEAVDDVRAALESGLARARRTGDKETLLHGLAFVMQTLPATGDLVRASEAAAEGVPLAEAVGDKRWMARFYAWAGMVANQAGDPAAAEQLAIKGIRTVEADPDPRAQILLTLLVAGLPEPVAAPLMSRLPHVDDLLDAARRLDDARYEPFLLRAAAGLALRDGDLAVAAARCAACIRLAHRQASWQVLPFAVLVLALVAARNGDAADAARFHGMVRRRVDVLRPATPPAWLDAYTTVMDGVRARLGDEVFEALARQGENDMHRNALVDVLGYADRVARGGSGAVDGRRMVPDQRAADHDRLTPRELEVLEELITGATNKEISHRLGMTPKTVMHHSVAIYRKLGVRGRAEATAWAFRHGLAD